MIREKMLWKVRKASTKISTSGSLQLLLLFLYSKKKKKKNPKKQSSETWQKD